MTQITVNQNCVASQNKKLCYIFLQAADLPKYNIRQSYILLNDEQDQNIMTNSDKNQNIRQSLGSYDVHR